MQKLEKKEMAVTTELKGPRRRGWVVVGFHLL